MSLPAIIVVNVALDVLLMIGLAHLMSWPRHFAPHGVKARGEEGREIIERIAHVEPSKTTDG